MDANRNYKANATNRFEEIGIVMQETAKTFAQAKERFEKSCTLCCLRNRVGKGYCEQCPIRKALLGIAEDGGWHTLKADDYLWLELERASC